MKNITSPLIISTLLLICSPFVFACSVGDSFLRPTNYEIVQSATSIIFAKYDFVEGGEEAEMRVIEVLKGGNSKAILWRKVPSKNYEGASDTYDFKNARPGAYSGSCSAHDYAAGKYYLLMRPSGVFSRASEEVDDENSPWVKAVKEYISLNPVQLKERMIELSTIDFLTPYQIVLLDDIRRHFDTPSYDKSTVELLDIWDPHWKQYISKRNEFSKLDDKTSDYYKQLEITTFKEQIVVDGTLWALSEISGKTSAEIFDNLSVSDDFLMFAEQISNYYEKNPSENSLEILFNGYDRLEKSSTAKYSIRSAQWKIMNSVVSISNKINRSKLIKFLVMVNDGEQLVRVLGSISAEYRGEALSILKTKLDPSLPHIEMLISHLAKVGDTDIFDWAESVLYKDLYNSKLAMKAFVYLPEEKLGLLIDELLKEDRVEVVYLLDSLASTYNKNKFQIIRDLAASKINYSKWMEKKVSSLEQQGDKRIRTWLKVLNVYPLDDSKRFD